MKGEHPDRPARSLDNSSYTKLSSPHPSVARREISRHSRSQACDAPSVTASNESLVQDWFPGSMARVVVYPLFLVFPKKTGNGQTMPILSGSLPRTTIFALGTIAFTW